MCRWSVGRSTFIFAPGRTSRGIGTQNAPSEVARWSRSHPFAPSGTFIMKFVVANGSRLLPNSKKGWVVSAEGREHMSFPDRRSKKGASARGVGGVECGRQSRRARPHRRARARTDAHARTHRHTRTRTETRARGAVCRVAPQWRKREPFHVARSWQN
jgi:hypothetical protein